MAREVLDPASQPSIARPVALQLAALLALHPRLMVVGFGTNEANQGVPVALATADLDHLLGRIAAASVPLVIVGTHVDCTVEPCTASKLVYGGTWDVALRELARKYHVGLVLDVEHNLTPDDFTDWIHPNAGGYAVIAKRVEAAVLARLHGVVRAG
jgi:lysophospholipase L1-like esterase